MYLAQYASRDPWPPVTIVLAAHGDPVSTLSRPSRELHLRPLLLQGLHYIHFRHPDTEDNVRLPFEELVGDQDDYIGIGRAPEDAGVRAMVVNPMGDNLPSDELSLWLNDKLQQRNAPESMAARHPIDMEDPRIREWTQEEADPVHKWLGMGRAHSFLKAILKVRRLFCIFISCTLTEDLEHEPG